MPKSKDSFSHGQFSELAKARPNNQNEYDVKNEAKHQRVRLIDFGKKSPVYMEWGMNKHAERDRIFKLSIDGKEALIAVEDIMRFQRWV